MKVIITESQLQAIIKEAVETQESPDNSAQNTAQTNSNGPEEKPMSRFEYGVNWGLGKAGQALKWAEKKLNPTQTQTTTTPDTKEKIQTQTTITPDTKEKIENLENNYLSGQIDSDDILAYLKSYGFTGGVLSMVFDAILDGVDVNGLFNGSILNMVGNNTAYGNFQPAKEWMNAVQTMGEWYEKNVYTYQGTKTKPRIGRKKYQCPLINGDVEDDCSAFIKACLQYFGISEIESISVTTATMQPGGQFDKVLLKNGFERLNYDNRILSPGDIICGPAKTHTEIYAGNGKSYGWGNVHNGSSTYGMPHPMSTRVKYRWIWRYVGGAGDTSGTQSS